MRTAVPGASDDGASTKVAASGRRGAARGAINAAVTDTVTAARSMPLWLRKLKLRWDELQPPLLPEEATLTFDASTSDLSSAHITTAEKAVTKLEILRENFSGDPTVTFPEPVREFTCPSVLTESFIEGVPILMAVGTPEAARLAKNGTQVGVAMFTH